MLSAEGAKPESNNRRKSDLGHVGRRFVGGWISGYQGCGAGAGAGVAGADTFGWSRSRSRRNGLLGAGAGAVKNGAAPAPKRDTIVARKNSSKIKRNRRTKSLPKFVLNN